MWYVAIAATILVVLAAAAVVALRLVRKRTPPVVVETSLEAARDLFHLRREMLEARFMTLAAGSGKPRGLTWIDCDFDNRVSFARDRNTRHLRALVAVTIRFEAVEGGDLEDNPNVGNLRAATAVFRFDNGQWLTDGRAIFNLNPQEAIKYYQHELETAE
jgi:hypothetical protein